MFRFSVFLPNNEIRITFKVRRLGGVVYAAETWTIKAADFRKLLAFEMRC